jgi:hypothetical protein
MLQIVSNNAYYSISHMVVSPSCILCEVRRAYVIGPRLAGKCRQMTCKWHVVHDKSPCQHEVHHHGKLEASLVCHEANSIGTISIESDCSTTVVEVSTSNRATADALTRALIIEDRHH